MWILLTIMAFATVPKQIYKGYDFASKHQIEYQLVNDTYTVVYFFNTDCPCSGAHFKYLNSLKEQYPGWSFIGFHSNKSVDIKKAQAYFDASNIKFPIIEDEDLQIANVLKAVKTPHVFVIDNRGEVLFQGGATNAKDPERASKHYLKEVLTALEKHQPLPYKVAKTLGCYIER
ncbi:MAG: redoxin domain-containing protein [Bdellovibrionales bacterium]|nr:redoxin domain-containing protein [Bdellovibrionales bacterium]